MGAEAIFRFYEELNDFLPVARRQREFGSSFSDNATVKQAIEALGVPHTEVEIILVNGVSVDFSRRVEDGDRVSVYPMFESLDVTPILRLRAQPLRQSRFVADAHLGRLAHYLRMLGFDTLHENALADRALVTISVKNRRVLLTRDRQLLMHRDLTHGVFVRGHRPRDQMKYVLNRLDLADSCRPFTRCMTCNGVLEAVEREMVLDLVPPRVARRYHRFHRCPHCARLYWRGTHWERMRSMIEAAVGHQT